MNRDQAHAHKVWLHDPFQTSNNIRACIVGVRLGMRAEGPRRWIVRAKETLRYVTTVRATSADDAIGKALDDARSHGVATMPQLMAWEE